MSKVNKHLTKGKCRNKMAYLTNTIREIDAHATYSMSCDIRLALIRLYLKSGLIDMIAIIY